MSLERALRDTKKIFLAVLTRAVRLSANLNRIWHSSPTTFSLRLIWLRLRNAITGRPRPLKLLLITDGRAYTSELQFLPIFRHASLLGKQLGLVAQIRKLDVALNLSAHALSLFHVIGLKLSFETPAKQAEYLARHFKAALNDTSTKFIYFDGDDDANVQWPAVLHLVDLYVKKQTFSEEKAYLSHYVGKSNLTNYVAKCYGVSFAENIIPVSGGLDPDDLGKLYVGWNLALDEPILELVRRVRTLPLDRRDYDVVCRASVPKDNWLYFLRSTAIEAIEAMSKRFRVLAPRHRVSRTEYWDEMLRSKICVSPFGYGEICWRDFEAIMCGSLLVKPDMSHLKTLPNLFVPGATYVPVQWDYTDLQAKCEYYLQNEKERHEIVTRARELLINCLQPNWFSDRFRDLLTHAGVKS